jgi:hypothetical protein
MELLYRLQWTEIYLITQNQFLSKITYIMLSRKHSNSNDELVSHTAKRIAELSIRIRALPINQHEIVIP